MLCRKALTTTVILTLISALKRTQELENMRYEKEIQQNKEQYEREMRALEDSYRKLIENERSKKLDLEKALELEHRKHEETMRQISE